MSVCAVFIYMLHKTVKTENPQWRERDEDWLARRDEYESEMSDAAERDGNDLGGKHLADHSTSDNS